MKSVGIFYNPNKENILDNIILLEKCLEKSNVELYFKTPTYNGNEVVKDVPELLLVLGGDGSVLRSLPFSLKWNLPVAGVNFGKFGFLTRYKFSQALQDINSILNFSKISKRALLQAEYEIDGEKYTTYALNDVVIYKGMNPKTYDYQISLDDYQFHNISGDGVIISTPTGSTAYSLSYGGSIISPQLDIMQLIMMAPHTVANCPLILEKDTIIRVKEAQGNKLNISIDGLPWLLTKEIKVRISSCCFKLLFPQNEHYCDSIARKFFWGKRG